MKKLFSIGVLFFFSLAMNAQGTKMADLMKESGKIYVVIAVMLTILAGLILYLVRLDRKISKLDWQQGKSNGDEERTSYVTKVSSVVTPVQARGRLC